MELDPYDVLGISHDASYEEIKKAYKHMLIQTHPDKMGDAKYFMLVHEAFNDIQKRVHNKKKEKMVPKTKQKYNKDVGVEVKPKKMKDFTPDKFNKYFEKNRIDQQTAYSEGYGNFMVKKTKKREDDEELTNASVYIPRRQIVVYKEPEYLDSSSTFSNCYRLGEERLEDFSGGGGTDIMKAYAHIEGEMIDTGRRYSGIDEIMAERSNQNMEMTAEEKRKMKRKEKKMQKMEQMRLNKVRDGDKRLEELYVNLHRRIQ
jgi:curved DNA-binding protein CbpA